ncbi:AAA family ATPase [Lysinibacillus boronitolerans]|uniref:AAA family ATPase n=1 Tax=Lysinibacillus boronitolerans TaxID=309788 RepID=UPI00289B39B3|nr:AAA family ATPase [Bacillus mobilis]
MRISKLLIHGYKNIKDVCLELNRLVIFIGENNSGKSNLLRATTLPLVNNEIGAVNKNLSWQDIKMILRVYTLVLLRLIKIKSYKTLFQTKNSKSIFHMYP